MVFCSHGYRCVSLKKKANKIRQDMKIQIYVQQMVDPLLRGTNPALD